MKTPQLLTDLLQLLFDTAVPAAMCTMVLAGLALRQESGVNFEVGGSVSAVNQSLSAFTEATKLEPNDAVAFRARASARHRCI